MHIEALLDLFKKCNMSKKKEKKQGGNKMLFLVAAAGLLAYSFMGGSGGERYFLVNGMPVPESQLRSMGYVYLNGSWWTPQQIQQAGQQGGVNVGANTPGSDPAWNVISTILATSAQFIPLIISSTSGGGSGGSGMDGGSGGSGGNSGGGGMGKIYGPYRR